MNCNIVVMNINELTSSVHPFLQENYAWVDECLREKYYNNFDDKEVLNEPYDYELVNNELDENGISILKPTPITWANFKSRTILKCIEDKDDNETDIETRNRTDSDISNYEVNVGKVILNAYSNSLLDNNFMEEYLNFDEFSTNSSEESYYSYDSY